MEQTSNIDCMSNYNTYNDDTNSLPLLTQACGDMAIYRPLTAMVQLPPTKTSSVDLQSTFPRSIIWSPIHHSDFKLSPPAPDFEFYLQLHNKSKKLVQLICNTDPPNVRHQQLLTELYNICCYVRLLDQCDERRYNLERLLRGIELPVALCDHIESFPLEMFVLVSGKRISVYLSREEGYFTYNGKRSVFGSFTKYFSASEIHDWIEHTLREYRICIRQELSLKETYLASRSVDIRRVYQPSPFSYVLERNYHRAGVENSFLKKRNLYKGRLVFETIARVDQGNQYVNGKRTKDILRKAKTAAVVFDCGEVY